MASATKRSQEAETEFRAALVVDAAEEQREVRDRDDGASPEEREKLELRGQARLTDFVAAALAGRSVSGASAEYAAAEGATDGGIPVALFEEARSENRVDAATPSPATVGVNLAPVVPAIFARSIAPTVGVSMPMVSSGTYGVPRITTNLSAGFEAKGAARDASAAALTVNTTTPHRLSARLSVRMEDIQSVGVASFEAALRQNLMLVMSDEMDKAILGADAPGADDINGLMNQLGAPPAAAALATFDSGLSAVSMFIDGLWAGSLGDVRLIVGVDTARLYETLWRDGTQAKGEISLASYLRDRTGGFRTNSNMPAIGSGGAAAKKQRGLAFRSGQGGITTATCPHWGTLAIDDIYSGSAKAERYLTMHASVGDVIVVHPDAYSRTETQVMA